MRGRKTFILLGLALAASGFAYLFAQAESPRQERRSAGGQSRITAGQTASQNPMREMMQAMMSGVVTPGIKPEQLPDPSSEGARLVVEYCAQCHNLPSPAMHSASEWPAIAERMFRRMAMYSQMGMGKMGGMGMGGMMGMMNMKSPSSQDQQAIVGYLKKYALASIGPESIPSPRSKGALLFAASCSQCHALPDPQIHTAEQWPGVVGQMQSLTRSMGKPAMSSEQKREIVDYLAKHAKGSSRKP
jgi:cytochrome c5